MNLLELNKVTQYFPVLGGILRREVGKVHAVTDVSFTLKEGETLGLVGESGSGKSTLGKTILRLIDPASGTIRFLGKDIAKMNVQELKKTRQHMQMIFQDPFASVDPRMTIGSIIEEPLKIHRIGTTESRKKRVIELLQKVGILEEAINQYPHEFSGGQRQRIGIARAIALEPKLIIADEPVSALDVSIQSQILNLLNDLQKAMNLTYIFIAHNLAVVKHISDRIAVMYAGRIVELAEAEDLYHHPQHPYTQALISAIPIPKRTSGMSNRKNKKSILQGDVPSLLNPPKGCAFHLRCPYVEAICKTEIPQLRSNSKNENHRGDFLNVGTSQGGLSPGGLPSHWVACHMINSN